MLSSIPLLDSLKKLTKRRAEIKLKNKFTTFYEIFNEKKLKNWEVSIRNSDHNKVIQAQLNSTEVSIYPHYSDVELLKLHIKNIFPDFTYSLIFHSIFGIYEIKEKENTKFIFSYKNGKYTPLSDIF